MTHVVIIMLLILANGLFALAEIAVVSSRVPRLQELAAEGRRGAAGALKLAQSPNRFLTTVQIGISFISVVAGAFGGTTLAKPLATWLERVTWLAPIADPLAFVLVVTLITYFTLLIGELVPKRIALNDPARYALLMAGPITWLSRAAAPLVWLLNFSSSTVLKLLRVKPRQRTPPSEEEFMLFLQKSRRAGIIKYEEQELIKNVFGLDQRTAASVMTPRNEVSWLDLDDSPATWLEAIASSSHTRLLVARGDLNDVVGVVSDRELLLASRAGTLSSEKLTELALPPIVVPKSANALLLFEKLNMAKAQIAMVVDKYGKVEGIVTLHDLFDALLGQLFGSHDARLLQVQPDGSWLVDGYYRAAELKEELNLKQLPENGAGYETVSGMMATALGRIPSVADSFEWEDYQFEVLAMDETRVEKVAASKLPAK